MKKVWKIDVPGRYGYSFAIRSNDETEASAIETASKHNLFTEYVDADYCSAEEITNDEYEMAHWKNDIIDIDEDEGEEVTVGVTLPLSIAFTVKAKSLEEAKEKARKMAIDAPYDQWNDDTSKMVIDVLD